MALKVDAVRLAYETTNSSISKTPQCETFPKIRNENKSRKGQEVLFISLQEVQTFGCANMGQNVW